MGREGSGNIYIHIYIYIYRDHRGKMRVPFKGLSRDDFERILNASGCRR